MSDVLDVTTTCLNAIRELPASDRRRVVSALTAIVGLTAPLAVRLVEERSPKDPPVKEKPARKPSPKGSTPENASRVLACIRGASPDTMTSKVLQRATGLSQTTMSRCLRDLLQDGLIERTGATSQTRYHATTP